ncbi:MAG: acetyltransferase [Planctomycetota bacterium]|mgnify:CR=1 FL=1|nr:MAG: acetyltransferase [Planctomycetota bacterium]
MATADVSRSRADDAPRGKKRKKKSHGFRNGCIFMLLLLGVVLYFAPAIVARTPLRDSLLQQALKLDGTITVGSASLGWFSTVEANDIVLRDEDAEPIISIASIRTDKQLVGLLLDFGNVGLVEVDKPVVHAVCREKTTNIEEMFATLIQREQRAQVSAQIKITGGTIDIEDVPTARAFRIESLNATCTIADEDQPIVVAASGSLPDGPRPGDFNLDLRTARSDDGKNPMAGGKIDCQTTALPLELADPILRRRVEGADLGGRLSTRLVGAWGKLAEDGEATIQGEALVSDLAFTAEALGRDRVKLERVEIPCHIVQRGKVFEVEQLALRCELGNVELSGTAPMDELQNADALAALLYENYELNGEIDLVEVARVLPETLRIREGTEITSGTIRLAMTSQRQSGETTWTGKIDASRLGANADGRALVWENPLAVDFAARQAKSGIVVERAECTSSFLHASASGNINDMTATASFDLARLVDELKQFADLSDFQLAGQGEAKLVLKRSDGDTFSADAEFEANGFQFVPIAGGEPWKEPSLIARLDVKGKFEGETLKRIDSGSLSVDVGQERLTAELREPIVDPAKSAWPLQCAWRGNLAPWETRLASCLDVDGWQLRGSGNVQATVNYSPQVIEIQNAECDLEQLQVWGHGWFVGEPSARITAKGRVDLEKRRAEISEARMNAGTTNAIVQQAVLRQSDDERWRLDGGTANVGADLVTLYRWRHDPRVAPAWRVSGRLAAEADLKQDTDSTTASINGTIDRLLLVDANSRPGAPGSRWEEPRITLAALANYRHTSGIVTLEQMQLAAAALRCGASGTVPTSEEGGDIDVKGTLEYDWQQLAPLWRPYLGDSVQIAGKQARTFAVQGRLSGSPLAGDSWKNVSGQAAVGWSGANMYGFVVGPGEVAATMADGQIRTRPIDVKVSDGQLTLSPIVQLSPSPAELYIQRGPVLSNIHLTPEMCKRGLKFVAPVVAETTVAEGRFSVTMDGARIPLHEPADGDLAGRMAIRAQVKPGPVAQEFMVLVNELMTVVRRGNFQPLNDRTGSLMSIDTNEIEFRMVGRRVYHKNLKFTLGTLPITTHGSVGLDDESLSMIAEVPIQANLLGQDLALGSLEGQTLKIPISGTLGRPKIDRGVIRQFTGQLLQNITRGVLLDGVNQQLDRLLPFQRQAAPSP